MIISDAGPMFLLLRLLPQSSYKSPQINAFGEAYPERAQAVTAAKFVVKIGH